MRIILLLSFLLAVLQGCGGSGSSGGSNNTTNPTPGPGPGDGGPVVVEPDPTPTDQFAATCRELLESDNFIANKDNIASDFNEEITLAMYVYSGQADDSLLDCELQAN